MYVNLTVSNRDEQEFPTECFCQDPKNITTSLPAGVIGDPNNVPKCSQANFENDENCGPDTQVGVAIPEIYYHRSDPYIIHTPLYNLETRPDQAGLLGFFLPLVNTPAYIVLSARTGGDYGLDAEVAGIEQLIPPDGFGLELWGVPADPSHDSQRCTGVNIPGFFGAGECTGTGPSNAELKPFLDSPTTCGQSLTSTIEVLSYDHGITHAEAPWPATTGCDQLSFNPSIYAHPTTQVTDSASGLDVDLRVPQLESPVTPAPSEIRASTVTLPRGMSINPNAADGKASCSDAEARLGTDEESQCPEFAKIGTLSLTSNALPGPLPGAIYIGEPKPGNRYRLILTANGFATHVKLAGVVEPDPETGQLVVSFQNLPQSPFSDFNLHFFGSERGLLATPTQCGTYPVTSTFTPWDAALPEQTSTQFFTLTSGPGGGPCPATQRPFNPGFSAGVEDATAGDHSPFSLEITRPEGNQNLSSLTVSTPPGLLATLRGIPYCSDADLSVATASSYSGSAEAANPSCPTASQIGASTASAGAGTHPVYLAGKVYLAGPYKGAPLSLAVITPASSGPYDLGNVVVRAAIHVNPETARITAVSDPLPTILQGIPLRLRSILVELNRPNFTLNPTNCDPFAVAGQAGGDQGGLATLNEHFQVASCTDLPFGPKLSLRVSGGTKRNDNPALHATLTTKSGEANIASTAVTLPHSEFLDNAHIQDPCTKTQFAQSACPPSSVIGFAKAETPLLDKPLEGPVYLRASAHKLPDIVAALQGQIDVELDGRVDSVHQRLRTTFETVPDAPVSKFSLDLYGGGRGLLVNSTSLCASVQNATVGMEGQNGEIANAKPVLAASCATKKTKSHRAARGHQ